MRRLALVLFVVSLVLAGAVVASPHAVTSPWLVRAGKDFQQAGEYTIRVRNTRFADAIAAYGEASGCRVVGSENHAVADWAARGIRIDLWTYGGLPRGETGCSAPRRICVSEIRLNDRRWATGRGLHIGDSTAKLSPLPEGAPSRPPQSGASQRVLAGYAARPLHHWRLHAS